MIHKEIKIDVKITNPLLSAYYVAISLRKLKMADLTDENSLFFANTINEKPHE
ncbi:hypothetical protein NT017_00740 [Prolixibacter sp. NT017]|nr:hypothetical protein NT017_00740 [Prolixibacter sp. NT017]